jgi:phage tail-like protein
MTATLVPATNGRAPSADGYVPLWMEERSRLLSYLPGIFADGEEASFLGRYLLIFETILDSIDWTVGQLPAYFAADAAPEEFLPWLASWVGLVLDEGWPVERRRAVLANAMELHRWRGTVRGLSEHLLLYTGVKPEIVERGSGLKLGRDSRLGHQTVLGRGDRSNHFSVILRVPDPAVFDRNRLRTVIEAQRPAHTTYALFVLPLEDGPTGTEGGEQSQTREANA